MFTYLHVIISSILTSVINCVTIYDEIRIVYQCLRTMSVSNLEMLSLQILIIALNYRKLKLELRLCLRISVLIKT